MSELFNVPVPPEADEIAAAWGAYLVEANRDSQQPFVPQDLDEIDPGRHLFGCDGVDENGVPRLNYYRPAPDSETPAEARVREIVNNWYVPVEMFTPLRRSVKSSLDTELAE